MPPATWVLLNHDVVLHATRLALGDPARGLRRTRAVTLLMLALPGSAYPYQGEELGLPKVTELPDEVRQDPDFFRGGGQAGTRDGCRVPIPWSGSAPPCGFGSAPGGPSWLPRPEARAKLSVEEQTGDRGSTLEFYRAALALRARHPALGAGAGCAGWTPPRGCWRSAGTASEAASCAHANLTGRLVSVPVPGRLLLLASADIPAAVRGRVALPGDTAVWWGV